MTLVTVPQVNPNDEVTALSVNQGPNAIAAVLNGNIDDTNVSTISGSKITTGTLPSSASNDSGSTEKFRQEANLSFIQSGLIWSTVSGLNAQMSSGVAYTGNGVRLAVAAIATRAFTASRDTYVSISPAGVVDGFQEVTNGANPPFVTTGYKFIAKVVTSGVAVTSVVDMRQLAPVSAANIDQTSTTTWAGWSTATFGTTQTSLGTKVVTIPAGCNYIEIYGSLRIQSADANAKDASVFISNNQNGNVSIPAYITVVANQTFAGANVALIDKVAVNPGVVTFDLRAVTTAGLANSSPGKILIKPVVGQFMSQAKIIRGDDKTISVPVSSFFPVTLGGYAVLYIIPLTSTPPDTYVDTAALITANLGPFASNVTSFDFVLTSASGSASSLIPLGEYNWYARFKDANNKITSIQINPNTVEVVPPEGEDC